MSQTAVARRRCRPRAAVRATVIAGIVAGSAIAVYAERGIIVSGLGSFGQARIGWVVAGFAAECMSMVAFALLQGGPLRAAGARFPFSALLGVAYTSSAITLAVPVAGSAIAAAYTQRQFRARGTDTAAVGLVLVVTGIISTVAFAVVAAVGAVVYGNPAAAVAGLVASLAAAGAAALVVVVLRWPAGRVRLRGPSASVLRVCQRLTRRPSGDPAVMAAAWLDRLGSVSIGQGAIVSAFGWALVNWAADILCLAAAVAAIGVGVPWRKLVLVWTAGSAAGSLSPTPYGLGVVDIALITALHGAGLTAPDAVGAVLLYRLISFKIAVTLAWGGYRYLRDRWAASPAADVGDPRVPAATFAANHRAAEQPAAELELVSRESGDDSRCPAR